MITKYYIMDIETGKYFYQYRLDEGFTGEINDAYEFTSYDSALNLLSEEYYREDLFKGMILEIKKLHFII